MTTNSGSFLDKAPDIIEASAKSPLALAALIILVLGFLAYTYFREAKETTRTIAFLVMGAVGFLLLMAILSTVSKVNEGASPGNQGKGPGSPSAPGTPSGEARVELGAPVVAQGVATARGPGIAITLPGSIRNAQGQNAQVAVNFTFLNGAPVWAKQAETEYRTVDGMVATGTRIFQLQTNNFDLSGTPMYIPYEAFNLIPSGYQYRIDLLLTATVYLNGVATARSPAVSFSFLW